MKRWLLIGVAAVAVGAWAPAGAQTKETPAPEAEAFYWNTVDGDYLVEAPFAFIESADVPSWGVTDDIYLGEASAVGLAEAAPAPGDRAVEGDLAMGPMGISLH